MHFHILGSMTVLMFTMELNENLGMNDVEK